MTSWQGASLESIANELKNIREILEKQSTTEQSSEVGKYCKLEDVKAAFSEGCLVSNREAAEEVIRVIGAIKQRIAHLPTIEVSEVGKWLRKDGRVWSRCSVCGSGSSFETNYCGNCGAAMEGHDVDLSE